MSLGGVSAACSPASGAPPFSRIYEYPLLLALSMACRPGRSHSRASRRAGAQLFLVATASIPYMVALVADECRLEFGRWGATAAITAFFAALMLVFWRHPSRQLVLALLMFATVVTLPSTVKRGGRSAVISSPTVSRWTTTS